ncbi:MAG: tetratricopeptide repeat protein [Candidatus Poseidonia sp.]|jgi:tetratricopeptide (TPR) repeat protein|nr:tetratricopeptide repeat protein [Poseidonia sp.]MEC8708477.1 tetratricopeptide repeat protein [Candidatus Thermoplasmatota archaeon]|tara:strand:+ start:290 stop:2815 length:2526 start_codon:yes stop_codon:yes gene_type:complete
MAVQAKPGVQERILLHLLDYSDFKDSIEVPFALSQMGIANAVAIARSNVPRAIAGLKDQGILVERQAHVKGVSRKRKAYFLTDTGVSLARETWERLSEFPVRCILDDQPAVSTTLGGAKSVLPFEMRPVDVIRYIDEHNCLDVRNLSADLVERDLSKHVEKQLVTALADLPRLRHFYGRATELDNMVNLLEARATTLLVPGIAGIGKTTVASKLIERFMHRRNLLYHRCQDWEGSRSFFESVADWLSSMGNSEFSTYLAATPVPQPADAAGLLVEALEGTPALLVIDDFHKVSDTVLHQTFQAMSLALLGSEEKIGLVIFSRSFKPVVPTKDAEGRIASLVLPLDGLDPESGRKLLTSFDSLEDEQWLHIHGLSRGHPLVLELINRGASAGAFHETLENYVTVEIFSKLSAEEKRVLSALSIFREPVELEALAQQGLNTDELDGLVESGLARQADSETYDVHDLIREFLLRSLSPALREEFHAKCVDWYQKQSSSQDIVIELIYHTIKSGKFDDASSLVVKEGRQLVSQGHMELLGLIEQIHTEELKPEVVVRLAQLQGDMLALLGRLDEAEQVLSDSLERAKKSTDELVQAEILSSMADVSRKQGKSDLSLSRHKMALQHYISLGDARWAARTYNNIGYLLRRKNERAKALEAYGEVEAILEGSDDVGLINSQITLARSLIDLGEVDRAREHAMATHERTSDLGDTVLHARAQAVLGRYYSKVEQSELALFHYSEALGAMTEAGDVQALVEITMLLGEVLHDAGRTDEAVEHYGQALVLAEANDLRMQIGELLTRLGGVAPDRQGRMEYLQRALTVFRELGAKNRMREVQVLVHRAVMSR